MKKIGCLLLIILSLTLSGCGDRTFEEYLNEEYPRLEYRNSSYNFDADNRNIEMPDGYVLNQGNSYEWVETKDGYDLIIHFVKEGD